MGHSQISDCTNRLSALIVHKRLINERLALPPAVQQIGE